MLWSWLDRWFGKKTLSGRGRGRRRSPGTSSRRTRPCLEELESRILPSTNFGELVGREYVSGHIDSLLAGPNANLLDLYDFKLNDAAFLDAQISMRSLLSGVVGVSVTGPESGDIFDADNGPDFPNENGALHISASAGSWEASVDADVHAAFGTDYTLALAADQAPGSGFGDGSFAFRADRGLDLGTLVTVAPTTVRDFIGWLDTSDRAGKDLVDTYFFDVPSRGAVDVRFDQMERDIAGGDVLPAMNLYRDVDGDGRLELEEVLGGGRAYIDVPGDPSIPAVEVSRQLIAGRYAVVIDEVFSPDTDPLTRPFGGTNYRLQVSYSVADNAGNTLATARDIGTVGSLAKTFTDYISSNDTTDVYKFSPSGGGPFIFNATLSGPSVSNANFDIDIIQDFNGSALVLASGTNPTSSENISADAAANGTYYVRVRRISGEGPYTMSISSTNTDHAGNTLGTATSLGDLFGQVQLADFVSPLDTDDIYKFTLTHSGRVTASFPATATGDADLQIIYDFDQDGTIDSSDILDSSANRKNAGESVSFSGLAGSTYFVRVLEFGGSPAYHLTLAIDTAVDFLSAARPMGLSGDAASTIEFVGPGDPTDIYKVSIANPLQLNLFFSLFGEAFTVTVGQDPNGNGVIDRDEALLTRTIATADDVRQVVNIPGKGVYFVKITSAGTLGTNYGIVFATAPTDNAGDKPETARNVGVLGPVTRTFSDFVGDGSIDRNARGDAVLGADDVDDYYRFTLGDTGPYIFTGQILGLTGNADIQLIRDGNLNQKVDVDMDEVLATSSNPFTANDLIVMPLFTPGTYYLRVFRPGSGTTGSANYTLSMTASSIDTAGNTLATAKNKGALSSTPITDSGFVGAIDLNDFYSFSVAGPGVVTVARNADVSGIGVEIINSAGEVLANSGGVQTFNGPIKLAASLPAAGTYYVRVLTNGINSNYTLSLSFANTVGTFALTPHETTVHDGQHVRLGLDWTVPEGSWHTLNSVDLQLRDRFGTVALIRFHEADNTVSLFDPVTGTFGPAQAIGSAGFLENSFVKVLLNTSSIKAAGPTSPTVTLTFDIEFKKPAYGRQLVVEAAASDDFGQVQDFAFAGLIDVLGSQGDKRRRRL